MTVGRSDESKFTEGSWPHMAIYHRQNSSFCMQHCCFELMFFSSIQYLTSIIQHCAFTTQYPHFKLQYSTSITQHCALTIQHLYFKTTDATFVCVFYRCIMYSAICVHRNPTFLFFFFTNQKPYFNFNFPSFTCYIRLFHCDVDNQCVC